jgi:hypothetical protein
MNAPGRHPEAPHPFPGRDGSASHPQEAASGGSPIDDRLAEIDRLEAELLAGEDTSPAAARKLSELRAERELLLIRKEQIAEQTEADRKADRLEYAEGLITRMLARHEQLKRDQQKHLKAALKYQDKFLAEASKVLSAPYQSHAAQAVLQAEARKFGLDEPDVDVLPTNSPELAEIFPVKHSLDSIGNEVSAEYVRITVLKRTEGEEYAQRLQDALAFIGD